MSNVLVVGGTKGIGHAIVQRFKADNHDVIAVGRSTPPIEHLEKLTHLIFCQRYRDAGDAWTGEINTSLSLTQSLIELYADYFDGDPSNSIVIMSSIIAHTVANEQPCSYHMAKAALEGMVRYYAVTLGRRRIRVNGISPCVTLKTENREYYAAHLEKVALFSRINPLGRMVTAEEVANVAFFLCSPAASAINGAIIPVDGGVSLVNQEALARSFLTNPISGVK